MPDNQSAQSNRPNSAQNDAQQDDALHALEDLIKKAQDKRGEKTAQGSEKTAEADNGLSREQIEQLKQQREQETQQLLENKQRQIRQAAAQSAEKQEGDQEQDKPDSAGHEIHQLDHIKVPRQDS